MSDREQIQAYIEQLKQASIAAMEAGRFTRGVELASSAKELSDWLDHGTTGEMPVDIDALLADKKPEAMSAPPTPEVPSPP